MIAYRNKDKKPGEKLVSVSDVVKEYGASYGRNFFSRYDYEECESERANKMTDYLRDLVSKSKPGDKYGSYVLQFADDFTYTDPVDGIVASKQGVRFVFSDASRIIFHLSGTGSAGATVRMYIEQFEPDVSKHDMDAQTALKPLIACSRGCASKTTSKCSIHGETNHGEDNSSTECKHMVQRKVEEINFTFIECLLYIFHHLAHKTPNATNSLCGYKIVMGQPSDRLGEDFSEYYKDFTERWWDKQVVVEHSMERTYQMLKYLANLVIMQTWCSLWLAGFKYEPRKEPCIGGEVDASMKLGYRIPVPDLTI